jgi:leucyl aminopeptidase
MSTSLTIRFAPFGQIAAPKPGRGVKADGTPTVLVVFAGKDGELSAATKKLLGGAQETVDRAAKATKFKGNVGSTLDILAPHGLAFDRLVVLGTVRKEDEKDLPAQPRDALAGGALMAKLSSACKVSVLFDPPQGASADEGAALAAGMRLRHYKFETYKTRKKDTKDAKDAKGSDAIDVTIGVADPAAVKRAAIVQDAIVEGVIAARDLVNEPANVLTPVEFAKRAAELRKLGVLVDILDVKAMQKLGMNTLLGVGQGSINESRMVVMRWNGGGKSQPVSFIGKGVTFDTGGISIKPAAGMEDMKGDMAGAACVTGLMRTFALRKAKANIIGAIGLVENMPGHNAQRPGDIVKSMSGQTVEVINTDAEGRLVLADVLWYIQDKYKPQFMINLATLTGAILIALGNEHAGLFSNNDELSERLTTVGKDTGEKVWRLPLSPGYDKMLDSKFADMKNVGGRLAGSITAAQFLQRFVNKTPWAHLDIAGTGMSSPSNDINQSWGSGWGVRLLDRLVAAHYEK